MRIIIDCTIKNEDMWMDIYDTIKHISIKKGIKQGQYILNNKLYVYKDLDNLYVVDKED